MSLAESLERAASALPDDEEAIRPANGDPVQLLGGLGVEGSQRVLAWMLEHEPAEAEELASAWLEEEGGPQVLASLDGSELPKAGRKVLRRIAHRARSRGIEIAEGQATPKVARLPEVEESIEQGYVSAYDPRGSRIVYLVESHPGGGVRLYEGLLDELRGVLDFQVYRIGRSQLRDFVRRLTRQERYPAIAAGAAAVRALIAAAAEVHPEARSLPKAFSEWRSAAISGADPDARPGEQVRSALARPVHDAAAQAALLEEIDEGGLGPWPPDPDKMAETTAAVRDRVEVQRSAAEASGEAPDIDAEEVRRALRDAMLELYVGELASATATRFEESAFFAWKQEQPERAQQMLLTASALRAGEAAEDALVAGLASAVTRHLADSLLESVDAAAEDDEPEASD